MMLGESDRDEIQIYLFVSGFHHGSGWQVEYWYPQESEIILKQWSFLAALALPDGAHNYDSDTVYFVLPKSTNQSIFGVSCYRQVNSKMVLPSNDVTRNAVQKSVGILCTKPLFGFIESKLKLITRVYFESGDFSQVSVLELAYNSLRNGIAHLSTDVSVPVPAELFIDLKPTTLAYLTGSWGVVLQLFKLVMLEKRVVVHGNPAHHVSRFILTLVSLFPDMLTNGIEFCMYRSVPNNSEKDPKVPKEDSLHLDIDGDSKELTTVNDVAETDLTKVDAPDNQHSNGDPNSLIIVNDSAETDLEPKHSSGDHEQINVSVSDQAKSSTKQKNGDLSFDDHWFDHEDDIDVGISVATSDYGLPLRIFSNGSCLLAPYVCLHQIDLFRSTRAFLLGATNAMFATEHFGSDVVVKLPEYNPTENEPNAAESDSDKPDRNYASTSVRLEFCGELGAANHIRNALTLSNADLRFVSNIEAAVASKYGRSNANLQSIEVMPDDEDPDVLGSDRWIRDQFKQYLVSLLALSAKAEKSSAISPSPTVPNVESSETPGYQSPQPVLTPADFLSEFCSYFVVCWQNTHNYRLWKRATHPCLETVVAEHPCHSEKQHYTVDDLKLRLGHVLQSTDRGRRVNDAFQSTSRALQQSMATSSRLLGQGASFTSKAFTHLGTLYKRSFTNTSASQQQQSREGSADDLMKEDTVEEREAFGKLLIDLDEEKPAT